MRGECFVITLTLIIVVIMLLLWLGFEIWEFPFLMQTCVQLYFANHAARSLRPLEKAVKRAS